MYTYFILFFIHQIFSCKFSFTYIVHGFIYFCIFIRIVEIKRTCIFQQFCYISTRRVNEGSTVLTYSIWRSETHIITPSSLEDTSIKKCFIVWNFHQSLGCVIYLVLWYYLCANLPCYSLIVLLILNIHNAITHKYGCTEIFPMRQDDRLTVSYLNSMLL